MDFQEYDYSLDMWSLGCMFASMVSFFPPSVLGISWLLDLPQGTVSCLEQSRRIRSWWLDSSMVTIMPINWSKLPKSSEQTSSLHSMSTLSLIEQLLTVSLDRYDLDLDSQFDDILGRYNRKPWTKFITSGKLSCPMRNCRPDSVDNQRYISNEAIDFLDKLLRYDHQERLTAEESQSHAYFGKLACVRH